jgi:hypothetical protein
VNLGKSEVVSVGTIRNMATLAEILGCTIGSLPITYLGMPLAVDFKAKYLWSPMLNKMERRLSRWKKLYLSKGGRLTLLNSTLSSLQTYYLSLFTIPISLVNMLEKILRNFLWGATDEDFEFPFVVWDKVCTPLTMGGLGIRKIGCFNQALLG